MYVRGFIAAIGVCSLVTFSPARAESQFTYQLKPSCDGSGQGVSGGNLSSKVDVAESTFQSNSVISSPANQSQVCAEVLEGAYSAFATLWSSRIVLTTIASASVKCNIEVSVQSNGNVSMPQAPVTMTCSGNKVFGAGLATRP